MEQKGEDFKDVETRSVKGLFGKQQLLLDEEKGEFSLKVRVNDLGYEVLVYKKIQRGSINSSEVIRAYLYSDVPEISEDPEDRKHWLMDHVNVYRKNSLIPTQTYPNHKEANTLEEIGIEYVLTHSFFTLR